MTFVVLVAELERAPGGGAPVDRLTDGPLVPSSQCVCQCVSECVSVSVRRSIVD
jgi:hypothetical protein